MNTTSLPSHQRKNLHPSVSDTDNDLNDIGSDGPLIRILVVDDEVLIADTIVQILNRSGFEAVAAYGGEEAIETARSIAPEIVLSDVLMPHVDGVEAAIAIRKFLPEVHIVLFSGQAATVEILARARKRGYHFELLAKPLHPVQLILHLRRIQAASGSAK